MKQSQKAALIRTVVISVIFILAAVGYYLYRSQPGWNIYHDEANSATVEKPEAWFADSIPGYMRVAEETGDSVKPSVLIKMDYPESIIPELGLDNGREVAVGERKMRRVDHEWDVPATGERQTFTFLMWEAPDGRKIIFEITPGQGDALHPTVEKVITSFKPI